MSHKAVGWKLSKLEKQELGDEKYLTSRGERLDNELKAAKDTIARLKGYVGRYESKPGHVLWSNGKEN